MINVMTVITPASMTEWSTEYYPLRPLVTLGLQDYVWDTTLTVSNDYCYDLKNICIKG